MTHNRQPSRTKRIQIHSRRKGEVRICVLEFKRREPDPTMKEILQRVWDKLADDSFTDVFGVLSGVAVGTIFLIVARI